MKGALREHETVATGPCQPGTTGGGLDLRSSAYQLDILGTHLYSFKPQCPHL